MIDAEISIALQLIQEKTNIIVPDIFKTEITPLMKKKWTVRGQYQPFGSEPYFCMIYINPVLDNMMDFEQAKIVMKNYGVLDINDDAVFDFLKRTNQARRWEKVSVVLHECGHYVHDRYLHNKPMYIPVIQDSTRKDYAHKNAKENFAVAFDEYVLEKIPKESKRYKKMDEILKGISIEHN